MITTIYLLRDPRDMSPRYIGKSIQPKDRYKQHCRTKCRKYWVGRWIGELQFLGLKPVMEILEVVDGVGWEEAECKWIAVYREAGFKICNHSDGGGGTLGHEVSLELREKLRVYAKQQWESMTESQKQAYRDFSKGRKQTPEEKAKQIAAQTGKVYSEQWRTNISKSLKGRRNTPEQMAKQIAVTKQKWASGERKVTEAMKQQYRTRVYGRKQWIITDAQREKLRASMKARLASLTPEQRRAKVQAALRARGVA